MSAQSMIGYLIIIVFAAIIWGVSGYVVSIVIIPWGNNFIATFMPMQDSYNTASLLLQIIVASPFLGLLLWGFDHINNANRQSGGDQ